MDAAVAVYESVRLGLGHSLRCAAWRPLACSVCRLSQTRTRHITHHTCHARHTKQVSPKDSPELRLLRPKLLEAAGFLGYTRVTNMAGECACEKMCLTHMRANSLALTCLLLGVIGSWVSHIVGAWSPHPPTYTHTYTHISIRRAHNTPQSTCWPSKRRARRGRLRPTSRMPCMRWRRRAAARRRTTRCAPCMSRCVEGVRACVGGVRRGLQCCWWGAAPRLHCCASCALSGTLLSSLRLPPPPHKHTHTHTHTHTHCTHHAPQAADAATKDRLLRALSRVTTPDLIRQTLDYTLSPAVRTQDVATVLTRLAKQGGLGFSLVWEFVIRRADDILDKYGGASRAVWGLGSGRATAWLLATHTCRFVRAAASAGCLHHPPTHPRYPHPPTHPPIHTHTHPTHTTSSSTGRRRRHVRAGRQAQLARQAVCG
jgi:hypothetical protein